MNQKIFVSYSHQDKSLVLPIVRLLRTTNDFVFFDIDSIDPGKKWRETLTNAIQECNLFVIFWCNHSCSSNEVLKEYSTAIEVGKDILPVLLDTTPLSEQLKDFQWLDFREFGKVKHRIRRPDINDDLNEKWSGSESRSGCLAGSGCLGGCLGGWSHSKFGHIFSKYPVFSSIVNGFVGIALWIFQEVSLGHIKLLSPLSLTSSIDKNVFLIIEAFIISIEIYLIKLILKEARKKNIDKKHAAIMAETLNLEFHQRLS